jgi:cell division septal protein FtsQ
VFGSEQSLLNLRARRNKRQKNVSSKLGNTPQSRRVYAKEAHPSVPVMVRGEVLGFPKPIRRVSKARRRLDVALPIPGAEMRFPAIPQYQIGMRLVSGLLTLTLGVILYFLWSSPFFAVKKIEVAGLQRLTSRDVNTVLNPDNQPIFSFSSLSLEKKLATAFPEFSKVSVEINMPNSVIATVSERVPILKWRQDGRTVLIDANGFAFPDRAIQENGPSLAVEALSSPPAAIIDPVKDATTQTPFLSSEMVSAIVSMGAQVPTGTTMIYDEQHGGLGWKDNRGWEVYLGDVRDIDMKLKVYTAILKKLKKEEITPILISVVSVHAPYIRVER